jgi:hypothetical protein
MPLIWFILFGIIGVNTAFAGLSGCDDLSTIAETPAVGMSTDIQPIFDTHCTACHGPPDPIAFMDLTLGAQDIVAVPSFQIPELNRVEPGTVSMSYLFFKINCNGQLSGNRMPRDAPPLNLTDQALIRDWINQMLIFKDGFEP